MTAVWSGLSIGAIYAVVAMCFNIGFVTSGVFNFAQAQFVTLGAFGAYVLFTEQHVTLALVFVCVIAVVVIVGIVQEQVSIRPIANRADHSSAIVTTVGASTIMAGAVLLIWGSEPLPAAPIGGSEAFTLAGGRIQTLDVVLILFAIGTAAALELATARTTWGLASRAIAEDRESASLLGVNTTRMVMISFAVAAGIAGVLGILSVAKTYASFNLADLYVVKAFAALAMFGFGSQKGALAGGFVVGLTEALTARYIGATYSNIIVFGLLLLVLMVRPHGVFGLDGGRRV